MKCDNKVRELTTMCLLWQQWTETSVWFDDVGISAFHSYVVVDLWQSFSEWCLLLFECVLVCRCQQLMDLASRQYTCSRSTVCSEFLASKQNCAGTPSLLTGSSPQ
jgi:hypothetical protein